MNIIKSFKNVFSSSNSKANNSTRRNPTGYEVSSYGGLDLSTGDKTKYLEAMHGWVYACVSAIADSMGDIQVKLYKTNKNGDVEEVVEHKSIDVLYKVNGFTTKFDHFWLTQAYLELTGESPWFVEKEKGEPSSLYFLRPDRLTPKPSKQNVIDGYRYYVDANEQIDLGIDEVIFLKNPNPANPFRGKGALESSAMTVDIDNESEKWNLNFFNNSARPDMIVKVKGVERMKEEQKEKLKKSLERMHKGSDKAHRLLVAFGDMDFEKFGFSQTDMDFVRQQEFARDKIMAMFRVPKAIIAQTEGVNLASANTSVYTFMRFTIKPKMERIIQQLNEFYLPMFKNTENMFFDYENPVPEDNEAKNAKYDNAIKNGWMTINEVRTLEGLEPLNGFDVPYMPFNLYPVTGEENSPVPPQGDLPEEGEEIVEEKPKEEEVDEEKKSYNVLKNSLIKKKNNERVRQMKARNRDLIEFDEKVEKLEASVKELIKEEIKKKGGKKNINSKEINELKKAIINEAGIDKLKEKNKRDGLIKSSVAKKN